MVSELLNQNVQLCRVGRLLSRKCHSILLYEKSLRSVLLQSTKSRIRIIQGWTQCCGTERHVVLETDIRMVCDSVLIFPDRNSGSFALLQFSPHHFRFLQMARKRWQFRSCIIHPLAGGHRSCQTLRSSFRLEWNVPEWSRNSSFPTFWIFPSI